MHLPWPVIGRHAELDAIAEAVRCTGGPRGVIVEGRPGTGKTTLLHSAARSTGGPTRWITGSAQALDTPFGVFGRPSDCTSPWELTAMLSRIRRTLTSGTLVVDDAHQLDPLSAAALNQLATDGVVTLVVTVRIGEPAPDSISALWKDRGFTRLALRCFDRKETDLVLSAALGGAVERMTVEHLWTVSQGNPLYLRHLAEGSVATGNLHCTHGIWQLRGPPVVSPELASILRRRCADAPADASRTVQLVAFGEPLELTTLRELASEASMLSAERTGLVQFRNEGSTLVARLSLPFLGEVIRSSVDAQTARHLRGVLAASLTGNATAPVHRIRVAELAADSDHPADAEMLTAAASDATALGSFRSAEGLARAATAEGGGLAAQLIHAGALAWTDRGRAAEQLLAALDVAGVSEDDLVRFSILRAGNLYWNLGVRHRAVEVLLRAHTQVSAPGRHQALDAVRATIDVSYGHVTAALDTADCIRRSVTAPPAAKMWAANAGCRALALTGRGNDVPPWAAEAIRLAQSETAVLRFAIGQGEVMALIYTGHLDRAEAAAARYLEMAGGHDAARFGISSLVGALELSRGKLAEATSRLEEAAAALDHSNPEWKIFSNLTLAQCLAVSGRPNDAAAAASRAEAALGDDHLLHKPQLGITRAWIAAASGNLGCAIGLARAAADTACKLGLLAVAADALHLAARFGDTAVASRLATLSTMIDGRLISPMSDHAGALELSDGDRLLRAAHRFELIGARLLAADAYAQAADAYRRSGSRRNELRASIRAHCLAHLCGDARTPALLASAGPLPLTVREHEIAVLAAANLTNHQIAERLSVSTRTVEGHIYHIFMKLEVPDREEMTETVLMETRL